MKKNGFTIFEVVVVVAIAAIIAAVGYGVYKRGHPATKPTSTVSTNQSSKATDVSTAPQIKTSSDLIQAEHVLNQNDPTTTNTSDSGQLNGQLSGF